MHILQSFGIMENVELNFESALMEGTHVVDNLKHLDLDEALEEVSMPK